MLFGCDIGKIIAIEVFMVTLQAAQIFGRSPAAIVLISLMITDVNKRSSLISIGVYIVKEQLTSIRKLKD